MPTIALGAAYSGFIQLSGATSASVSGLPPGVTAGFVPATQRIEVSGTPTVGGTYNLVAHITNTCGGGLAPHTISVSAGALTVGASAGPAFNAYSPQYSSDTCNIQYLMVNWSAVGGATGFEIEAMPAAGATIITGVVTDADVLSIVPDGTNDGVRIRALTAGAPSAWTYTGPLSYNTSNPACSPQPS